MCSLFLGQYINEQDRLVRVELIWTEFIDWRLDNQTTTDRIRQVLFCLRLLLRVQCQSLLLFCPYWFVMMEIVVFSTTFVIVVFSLRLVVVIVVILFFLSQENKQDFCAIKQKSTVFGTINWFSFDISSSHERRREVLYQMTDSVNSP